MCGIYFSCSKTHLPDPDGSLRSCLEKRGPDCCNTIRRKIQAPRISGINRKCIQESPIFLNFFASVLSLRGDSLVEQPLVDPETESVLCWNGEAWKIDGKAIIGNDAVAVFDLLINATTPDDEHSSTRYPDGNESYISRIVGVFSRITGPYAFIYYDACNAQIFYGRDVLGRRSLVMNKHRKESFAISSICDPDTTKEWEEIESYGIYVLDLCTEWNVFQQSTEEDRDDESLGPMTNTFSGSLSINTEVFLR